MCLSGSLSASLISPSPDPHPQAIRDPVYLDGPQFIIILLREEKKDVKAGDREERSEKRRSEHSMAAALMGSQIPCSAEEDRHEAEKVTFLM